MFEDKSTCICLNRWILCTSRHNLLSLLCRPEQDSGDYSLLSTWTTSTGIQWNNVIVKHKSNCKCKPWLYITTCKQLHSCISIPCTRSNNARTTRSKAVRNGNLRPAEIQTGNLRVDNPATHRSAILRQNKIKWKQTLGRGIIWRRC